MVLDQYLLDLILLAGYMTTSSFEKRLNNVIYDILNSCRLFTLYQRTVNSSCMVEYLIIYMFLKFKQKYAS